MTSGLRPCSWSEQRPIFEQAPRQLIHVDRVDSKRCQGVAPKTRPDAGVYFFGEITDNISGLLVSTHSERCLRIHAPDYAHRPLSGNWINPKLLYLEVFFNPHYGAYWIYDVEQERVVLYELQNDGWDAWVQCSASDYRGDGTLVDHGTGDAEHRYTLDLGPVAAGEATYRLENLPPREFTLGLEITGPEGECLAETKPINPVVSLRMEDDASQVVLAEEAPLRDWVWSGSVLCDPAFVYRRGRSKEVSQGSGSSTHERVGLKADGGWGTYFTPRRSTTYRLTVSVSPGRLEPYRLRLKAETSGWK